MGKKVKVKGHPINKTFYGIRQRLQPHRKPSFVVPTMGRREVYDGIGKGMKVGSFQETLKNHEDRCTEIQKAMEELKEPAYIEPAYQDPI